MEKDMNGMIDSMWIDFLSEAGVTFDGDFVTFGGQETLIEFVKDCRYVDENGFDSARLELIVKYNEEDVIWLEFLAINDTGVWRLCDGIYTCELVKGIVVRGLVQMIQEREWNSNYDTEDCAWGRELNNYIQNNKDRGLIKYVVGFPELYDWNGWHESVWVEAGRFFG